MILGYQKFGFTEPFVTGAGGRIATHQEILDNFTLPMASAGLSKGIVPDLARKRGLDFYYIDTGYFGNHQIKKYFRITKNACQNTGPIRNRPRDRLDRISIDKTKYRRGRSVMIVPVDDKVCGFYKIGSKTEWLESTKQQLAKLTDRPLIVRDRPASRADRTTTSRFVDAIREGDVNAVIVYSSNCAVEAAMHGIPVVCLGESAAKPVSCTIDLIDSLPDIDPDLIEHWLRHLSYCQFTQKEMRSGLAWNIINE